MKKLFILATAAVALASCSDSDLVGNIASSQQTEQPQAVEFGTYLGTTATRAAYDKGVITNAEYTDDNSLKNAKFGVFAYYTGATDYVTSPTPSAYEPNFMYNQEISWGSTLSVPQWIYSPVKYWPNGIDADNKENPSYTAQQSTDGKVSFFAFAPFTATPSTAYADGDGTKPSQITSNDVVKKNAATKGVNAVTTNAFTGNVWVKYLMPNAASTEAVDLLWGLAGKSSYNETDGIDPSLTFAESYNINLTKQKVDEKVNFLFKHALAKVGGSSKTTASADEASPKCGFKVVVDVDENNKDNQYTYFGTNFDNTKTLVTIEKVEIMDGKSAAEASPAMAETGTKSNFNTFGWFNIETGSWCNEANTYGNTGEGSTYSITAQSDETVIDDDAIYVINKDIREPASVSNPSGTWSIAGTTGVTTTPKPLFANEDVPALLVIPGGTDNNTLYVRIKYRVRTADTNLKDGFSNVSQIITNRVNLGSSLDPNKYYTIIIHLGLTSVKFEAVVSDWTHSENAVINNDGTVTENGDDNSESIWLPSNVVEANTWSISPAAPSYAAKGETKTLTVQMNGSGLAYATAADAGKYTLAKVGTADWLTINTTNGEITAAANTTTAKRTAVVNVSTIVNGKTITTPVTIEQAAYSLSLTKAGNVVTVKDGDSQSVTGFTSTVSGGDGNGTQTVSESDITVGGTVGQTYTVTVNKNGATATETVTVAGGGGAK